MLWVLTLIVLAVSASLYPRAWTLQEFGLGAYLSVVWTLPTLLSVMAVIGAVQARRSLTRPIGARRLHCDELLDRPGSDHRPDRRHARAAPGGREHGSGDPGELHPMEGRRRGRGVVRGP